MKRKRCPTALSALSASMVCVDLQHRPALLLPGQLAAASTCCCVHMYVRTLYWSVGPASSEEEEEEAAGPYVGQAVAKAGGGTDGRTGQRVQISTHFSLAAKASAVAAATASSAYFACIAGSGGQRQRMRGSARRKRLPAAQKKERRRRQLQGRRVLVHSLPFLLSSKHLVTPIHPHNACRLDSGGRRTSVTFAICDGPWGMGGTEKHTADTHVLHGQQASSWRRVWLVHRLAIADRLMEG
jgi:hypothetical protein